MKINQRITAVYLTSMPKLYNIPYLPHVCRCPLDNEYMNLGDLYFDRSLGDSGYIAVVSPLQTFQLDSALKHTQNIHHRFFYKCLEGKIFALTFTDLSM
jgi:hypothetical protein